MKITIATVGEFFALPIRPAFAAVPRAYRQAAALQATWDQAAPPRASMRDVAPASPPRCRTPARSTAHASGPLVRPCDRFGLDRAHSRAIPPPAPPALPRFAVF